jgi:hypothetical protein
MTDNNETTEVHVYKPDDHSTKNFFLFFFYLNKFNFFLIGVVIEGEKHSTNEGDPNSSAVTETHDQKEQLIIENPDDSVSVVTHRLEDVHVTFEHENSTPVIQETG